MSVIRSIKIIEMLLRKYPNAYSFGKRLLSLFYNDKLYDYQGLIDNFASTPNVIYFRNYGAANPNTPIYYISYGVYNQETCGFFGMLNTTLKYLLYADFYHLTPVIHWDKCIYREKASVFGTDNVFEYYFKPVSNISYKTVIHSQHVSPAMFGDTKITYYVGDKTDLLTEKNIKLLSEIYRKYIKLNDITFNAINNEINQLLKKKKTLGVQARGSDGNWELFGHPIAVTIDEYIEATIDAFYSNEFEQIFLATEDPIILNRFQDIFDDKLVYYKDNIRSEKSAIDIASEYGYDKLVNYKMGYEVLRDAYTLAECDGLVGGIHNVPLAARIIKNSRGKEFKICNIIDKGLSTKKRFYLKKLYRVK